MISLSNTNFTLNSAVIPDTAAGSVGTLYGAAFDLDGDTNATFTGCSFNDNSVQSGKNSFLGYGGTGHVSNTAVVQLLDCTMSNNTADYGGALALEGCGVTANAATRLSSNAASVGGGAVFYTSQIQCDIPFASHALNGNTAIYGNNFASGPFASALSTDVSFEGVTVALREVVAVTVYAKDLFDNTISVGPLQSVTLSNVSCDLFSNDLAVSSIERSFSSGIAVFGFSLYAPVTEDSDIQCVLALSTETVSQPVEFIVNLTGCSPGSAFDANRTRCLQCSPGSYSIVPNGDTCYVCPPLATCVRSDTILSVNGFYLVADDNTGAVIPVQCSPGVCTGSPISASENQTGVINSCAPNRDSGAILCSDCVSGYQELNGACVACAQGESTGWAVAVFVLWFVYVLLLHALSSLESESTSILLFFAQIATIILSPWNATLDRVTSVLNQLGAIPLIALWPCPYNGDPYVKYVMTLLGPIVLVAYLGLVFVLQTVVWLVALQSFPGWTFRSKLRPSWSPYIRTMGLLFVSAYETIVLAAQSFLVCKDLSGPYQATGSTQVQILDFGIRFADVDTNIDCREGTYRLWLILYIPLVVLGFFVPAVLWAFLYVKRRRGEFTDPKFVRRYGFLFDGFKEQFYFWSAYNLWRRYIISLVFILIPYGSSLQRSVSLETLLCLLFFIHLVVRPYAASTLSVPETPLAPSPIASADSFDPAKSFDEVIISDTDPLPGQPFDHSITEPRVALGGSSARHLSSVIIADSVSDNITSADEKPEIATHSARRLASVVAEIPYPVSTSTTTAAEQKPEIVTNQNNSTATSNKMIAIERKRTNDTVILDVVRPNSSLMLMSFFSNPLSMTKGVDVISETGELNVAEGIALFFLIILSSEIFLNPPPNMVYTMNIVSLALVGSGVVLIGLFGFVVPRLATQLQKSRTRSNSLNPYIEASNSINISKNNNNEDTRTELTL